METTTPGDKYAEIYESAYNDVTKLVDKSVSNPTVKTAQIYLSNVSNITNATIEFTSTDECTFDNISMK